MSLHFYKAKVTKIVKETSDCVRISFKIPEENQVKFFYKSGQYLNLKIDLNGEEIRRSYSICSAPFEDELSVAVKKIANGKFSTFATGSLKVGTEIELMPPMGNFILPETLDDVDTLIFYCAGSGITPVISLIKTILRSYQHKNVILYYGNRHTDSIIFREELENLKNLYTTRFSLNYILTKERLSSDLFYGRLNGDKCQKFEQYFSRDKSKSLYYLCGPSDMIFEIKEALIKSGVQEKNIHFELFTTAGISNNDNITTEIVDKKINSKIILKLDGLTQEFDFDNVHDNILDAALANGADLPFACKGGVCSTCKARCEEGEVSMKVNYALEADELADRYVLTCQARPLTEKVFINFDY
jgi:ring-1,2-phenylacetyl-CoA epoxidase subunit PaaE